MKYFEVYETSIITKLKIIHMTVVLLFHILENMNVAKLTYF
jgi:hypothetical protein